MKIGSQLRLTVTNIGDAPAALVAFSISPTDIETKDVRLVRGQFHSPEDMYIPIGSKQVTMDIDMSHFDKEHSDWLAYRMLLKTYNEQPGGILVIATGYYGSNGKEVSVPLPAPVLEFLFEGRSHACTANAALKGCSPRPPGRWVPRGNRATAQIGQAQPVR
jgi:hypothetical protein